MEERWDARLPMGLFTVEVETGKITTIHRYDLQRPRGEVFWLAGYRVDTGERTWYHMTSGRFTST